MYTRHLFHWYSILNRLAPALLTMHAYIHINQCALPFINSSTDITGKPPALPLLMPHHKTSGKADYSSIKGLLCLPGSVKKKKKREQISN